MSCNVGQLDSAKIIKCFVLSEGNQRCFSFEGEPGVLCAYDNVLNLVVNQCSRHENVVCLDKILFPPKSL